MRKNPFLITLMCMVLAVAGCDGGGVVTDSQRKWADSLMNATYISRDYQRIMTLADSLKATGLFSEGKTCYWLGYEPEAHDLVLLEDGHYGDGRGHRR